MTKTVSLRNLQRLLVNQNTNTITAMAALHRSRELSFHLKKQISDADIQQRTKNQTQKQHKKLLTNK